MDWVRLGAELAGMIIVGLSAVWKAGRWILEQELETRDQERRNMRGKLETIEERVESLRDHVHTEVDGAYRQLQADVTRVEGKLDAVAENVRGLAEVVAVLRDRSNRSLIRRRSERGEAST